VNHESDLTPACADRCRRQVRQAGLAPTLSMRRGVVCEVASITLLSFYLLKNYIISYITA